MSGPGADISLAIIEEVIPANEGPLLRLRCLVGPLAGTEVTQPLSEWGLVNMRRAIKIKFMTVGRWAFTVGMHHMELPELEVRDIALWLAPEVTEIMNEVVRFMAWTGHRLKAGDTISLGAAGGARRLVRLVHLEPLAPYEHFYAVERLALVDDPRMGQVQGP